MKLRRPQSLLYTEILRPNYQSHLKVYLKTRWMIQHFYATEIKFEMTTRQMKNYRHCIQMNQVIKKKNIGASNTNPHDSLKLQCPSGGDPPWVYQGYSHVSRMRALCASPLKARLQPNSIIRIRSDKSCLQLT